MRPGTVFLANEGSSETVKANLATDLHGLEDCKIGLIFNSLEAQNKTPASYRPRRYPPADYRVTLREKALQKTRFEWAVPLIT
jgi:hypothetical protein